MNKPIIYIMGVSGSGKSTIGELLSAETGIPFFDGDDYHPEENIRKMATGKPLNDKDRQGWLQALNKIARREQKNKGAVIISSALREAYRKTLTSELSTVHWVYLKGSFETISKRLESREHKYMPASLLQSQFDTLEEPKYGIYVDISQSPAEIVSNLQKILMDKSEFGLYGLGVMGKSLSRNLARHGFRLSLFNRFVKGAEEQVAKWFIDEYKELSEAKGFEDTAEFVNSLERPRKIFLMVQAGRVTDSVIKELLPHLEKGDILIDGGNANYQDTARRIDYLAEYGIDLIGAGVSGGEAGALNGPSIMPGGSKKAYEKVKSYLETIAARDSEGTPCCTYLGAGGSGHFVKMVHNGIEYSEMQLIAEAYQFLRFAHGMNPDGIADVFESWREGDLDSFLLEITINILRKKEKNGWLIDQILDKAGNKGTGSWTTIAAAELGVPATMISSALFARYLSAFKEERTIAGYEYETKLPPPATLTTEELGKAYQLARVINHHQGFHLISAASQEFGWNLKLPELARIWTNGCIIRSDLMQHLIHILKFTDRILLDSQVQKAVTFSRSSLENMVGETVTARLDSPCFSAALNFLNGYTSSQSAANIIQAQRDYFGAHTYKRADDPDGPPHHTDWNK